MMSDLASSIMRRRASIEPQEEEEEEDDAASRRGGGGSGVLGLRAYLAAKDGAAPAQKDEDEWE